MAVRRRVYEKQARLSVIMAALGGVCMLAAAAFILQRFDTQSFLIVYNPRTLRIVAIGTALFLGLAGGTAGFFLGFNSAGQRTNTRNKLSWTGFFLSAAVIALTISCGVFFWLLKFAQTPPAHAALGE